MRRYLRGVIRYREDGPYMARIREDGRQVYLGSFPTEEEAAAAYVAAKRRVREAKARAKAEGRPAGPVLDVPSRRSAPARTCPRCGARTPRPRAKFEPPPRSLEEAERDIADMI